MPASYEELVGKMRVEPTFSVAEDVIKKDFKLKLPSRTFIHMYNSPELGDFRGYQSDLDNTENRKQVAQKEQLNIQQAAMDEGVHMPDMNMVAAAHNHQDQAGPALQQHMDFAELGLKRSGWPTL